MSTFYELAASIFGILATREQIFRAHLAFVWLCGATLLLLLKSGANPLALLALGMALVALAAMRLQARRQKYLRVAAYAAAKPQVANLRRR